MGKIRVGWRDSSPLTTKAEAPVESLRYSGTEVSDQGPGTRSSPGVCGGGREGAGGGAGDAGEGARAPHSGLV